MREKEFTKLLNILPDFLPQGKALSWALDPKASCALRNRMDGVGCSPRREERVRLQAHGSSRGRRQYNLPLRNAMAQINPGGKCPSHQNTQLARFFVCSFFVCLFLRHKFDRFTKGSILSLLALLRGLK